MPQLPHAARLRSRPARHRRRPVPGPRCANATLATCNWVVADPARSGGLCRCCRLTRTRPADDDPRPWPRSPTPRGPSGGWCSAAGAGPARRPLRRGHGSGLAFDLLSSRHGDVITGHDGRRHHARPGRVRRRPPRAGPRRPAASPTARCSATSATRSATTTGRCWSRPTPAALERFRKLFGDERVDYADSLDRHYAQGPPPGWPDSTSAPTPPCTRGRTGPRRSPTTSTSATPCRRPARTACG